MIYGAQYIQLLTLGVPVQSSLPSAVTNCTKSFDIITRSTICFQYKGTSYYRTILILNTIFCVNFWNWELGQSIFIFSNIFLTYAIIELLISAISKSVTNKWNKTLILPLASFCFLPTLSPFVLVFLLLLFHVSVLLLALSSSSPPGN